MSDIQIAVGAQDQASKILQGVEKNTQMLARSVNQMAAQTVASTQRMEIAFRGLSAAAGVVTAIIGAVKAVGAVFNAGGAAMEAFSVQEQAVRGLTNALQLQGVEASKSIASHQQFAAQLQNTTNVGDEFTLGLMKTAANLGFADDQLQEAAKAAIGLSEATGMNAEESLKKLNQALNGNASAFAEVIPQMKNVTSEEQKLAMVSELATRGLLQKADATKTLQGTSERVAGAVGDLMEKIGALLAPIQSVVNNGFAILFETLQSAVEPAIGAVNAAMDSMQPIIGAVEQAFQATGVVVWAAIESIVSVIGSLTTSLAGSSSNVQGWGDIINATVDWIAKSIIGMVTMAEVAFTNLPSVFAYVGDAIRLRLETMRADIEHVLMVAIPTYASWLATEFPNLMTDMGNAVLTIVQNLTTSVLSVFQALFQALESRSAADAARVAYALGTAMSTNLLDGFEATTSALPNVAERAATATEIALAGRMNTVGLDLATQFTQRYEERIGRLGVQAKEQIGDLTVNLGKSIDNSGIAQKMAELRVSETRLLSRGSGGEDPTAKVAANTEATNTKLDNLPEKLAAAIAAAIPGLSNLLQVEVLDA
jgi:hypothetical protein